MELVDEIYYRVSRDSASVAITADYPGLLPASHVSKAEAIASEEDSFLIPCLMHKYRIFIETTVRARHRAAGDSSAKGVRIGQA